MEHSKNFEKIKKYYTEGTWNKKRVHDAIGRWITEEEYIEIVGVEE